MAVKAHGVDGPAHNALIRLVLQCGEHVIVIAERRRNRRGMALIHVHADIPGRLDDLGVFVEEHDGGGVYVGIGLPGEGQRGLAGCGGLGEGINLHVAGCDLPANGARHLCCRRRVRLAHQVYFVDCRRIGISRRGIARSFSRHFSIELIDLVFLGRVIGFHVIVTAASDHQIIALSHGGRDSVACAVHKHRRDLVSGLLGRGDLVMRAVSGAVHGIDIFEISVVNGNVNFLYAALCVARLCIRGLFPTLVL